jgi:hypothetical protein
MSQCENHERLLQVALDFGWELYEYGTDSECIVGGKETPHLALIWLKPCAWDEGQMIPVGCVCCTNLDEELMKWHEELHSVMENRRLRKQMDPMELPPQPQALGPAPDWLPPYRAR